MTTEFFETQIYQMKIWDGRTIYCDGDNRWFISGEPRYFNSLTEVLEYTGLKDTNQKDLDFVLLCREVFENIVAPVGAGITIEPTLHRENLAQRFYEMMKQRNYFDDRRTTKTTPREFEVQPGKVG